MFKQRKNKNKEKENIYFENLAPIDYAEIDEKVEKAFEYAIKDKNVKNIGLTGIYSAGKSSIVKTCLKKNKIDNESLIISLAKFEDCQNEDITEVEKEIIEKLYYSKGAHPLREGFKNFIWKLIISSGIMGTIYLGKYQQIDNLWQIRKTALIFSGIVVLSILYTIIHVILKIYNKYSLKLNIGNINIEVDNASKDESILDKYIDFIFKIVKDKKYKYFIFEDIDRFKKDKILLNRLRDLNETLNEKYDIKFLYEIRDGEFKNTTRTKFFDFIIPIVPYISFGTSNTLLNELIKKNNLDSELSKEFISDICLFINDPRLLINILNEYIIYRDSINNEQVSYKKIFVYILYKNLFPDDFGNLQEGRGYLYNYLEHKKLMANDIKKKIADKELEYETNTPQIYKDLIDYLIKEDLFDENYESYISRFRSDNITKEENLYLTRIKRNFNPEINFKVNNLDNFMKKLFMKDYQKDSCINVYILNGLVNNPNGNGLLEIYTKTIISSKYYMKVLAEICNNDEIEKEKCIQVFIKADLDICDSVLNNDCAQKNIIIQQIVLFGTIDNLKKLNNLSELSDYIGENNLLQDLDKNNFEKLKELDVKYSKIEELKHNTELYNYVIENQLYEINEQNIVYITGKSKSFKLNNLDLIFENEYIKEYVFENINEYIEIIFTKLPMQHDKEENIKEILSLSKLTIVNGKKILELEKTIFKDITQIKKEYWKDIFERNLEEVNETNIKAYINYYGVDEKIVNIFNENMDTILRFEMDKLNKNDIKLILLNENLSFEMFKILIECINDWSFTYSEVQNIKKDLQKMEYLISKKLIVDIYNYVRSNDIELNSNKLRIAYVCAEQKYSKIINLFDFEERYEVLNTTDNSELIAAILNNDYQQIDVQDILNNTSRIATSSLSLDVVNKILQSDSIGVEDKINTINKNFYIVTAENIGDLLENVGENYRRIVENGKTSKINNNEYNLELIKNIRNLNYRIEYTFDDKNIFIKKNKKK